MRVWFEFRRKLGWVRASGLVEGSGPGLGPTWLNIFFCDNSDF